MQWFSVCRELAEPGSGVCCRDHGLCERPYFVGQLCGGKGLYLSMSICELGLQRRESCITGCRDFVGCGLDLMLAQISQLFRFVDERIKT
jgi:hypothetical protein